MKKLIAISVVFALIAGTAFAADLSVDVIGKVNVVAGDTAKYDAEGEKEPVKAGGLNRRIRMTASGENDDGTFGGWIRFQPSWGGDINTTTDGSYEGMNTNPSQGQFVGAWGYTWWKPVEQIKILLGGNPDGLFGADGLARWGFYGVAGDTDVVTENWKLSDSFYGGWGKSGLVLTVTPIEPLEFNVAIPYMEQDHMWGDDMMAVYKESVIQAAYNAEGLGKFALTFALGKGVDEKKGWAEPAGSLWLFAGLTMIENLEIDIGLGYVLPYTAVEKIDVPGLGEETVKVTHAAPIAFGVAAKYDAGDFGVKARIQAKLAGKETMEGADAVATPLNLVFDGLPYYNINENLSFLFSFGVDFTAAPKKIEGQTEDPVSVLGWHVEPYITIKGGSNWFPNFYAGIRIETSGVKDSGKAGEDPVANTHWSVPIGIAFSF